jgi:carboxyl-terminal processing protease
MFGDHSPFSILIGRLRVCIALGVFALLVPSLHAADDPELARGKAALDKNDYAGAQAIFDGILEKNAADVAAHIGRGRSYFCRDDLDHALTDYSEALRLDPKSTAALLCRQTVLALQNKFPQALADSDALIELDPKKAVYYKERAWVKQLKKDYAGSLDDVSHAIALDKKDASFFELRANVLVEAGSYSEALDDLGAVIRLDGKNAENYNVRAMILRKLGRYREAIEDFRDAARFDKAASLYVNNLAWILATCADEKYLDGAQAVVLSTQACEKSAWKEFVDLDTLAAAYARVGDFENAVRWQTKAIELTKDAATAEEFRARLALYQRKEAYVEKPADQEKIDWSLQRSACFETIWNTVNENYFDTTFGGVDWVAMREKYRLRLWAATDKRALRGLLQGMLDELHRTHFSIVPRELSVLTPEERGRIGYTGAEAASIEDKVTIVRVKPDSPAQKAGLKPGDVVRKAGTVVLSEMAATMAESVDSPRRRMLYLRGFVNWWLAAPVGDTVVLELEDAAGAVREVKMVSVPFEGIWSEPMGFCPSEPVEEETSRGPDGVVYLRFNVFALPAMNEFKRCVHSLKDGEGLIIDLRGNPGGITLMAPGIFGRLSAKEVSLGTMHRRYGSEEFTAYPQRGAFLGPVAVLVDSASASTSEILAAGLQETGRARIFGEATAGAALPSMFRNLPTGDMLQYAVADIKTPHGMLIEGNGVTPDELVVVRRADCAAGRDPVREAAEHWLATQRQKPATEVARK